MRLLRRRARLVAATAVLALALAACGSDDPGAEPEEEEPAVADEPEDDDADADEPGELRSLTVGTLPIVDAAPLWIAIEEGLFADEGLEVETVPIPGGAAAVPALDAGELDISNGNHVSFILAASEGLDIRLVNEATYGVSMTNALIVPEDSEIDGPADMAGATIALNTFANITELIVRATLEDAGVGPDDYTFTEVPFPDQGAALERGDIDVGLLPEPFITILAGEGNKVVGDPMTTPVLEGLPLVGYSATGEFVADNPDVIESFQRAMAEATQLAMDDPSFVSDALLANTEMPEALVEQITLPGWATTPELEGYERTQELMLEYGLLSDPVDNLAELVVD
jgi:ABC-type nitrate/sulfonate/bicarbonate transport system substrate-binding protein